MLKVVVDTNVIISAFLKKDSKPAMILNNDNKFLDCAFESKAGFVVTGNSRHFNIRKFENTLIISPADFLEIVF